MPDPINQAPGQASGEAGRLVARVDVSDDVLDVRTDVAGGILNLGLDLAIQGIAGRLTHLGIGRDPAGGGEQQFSHQSHVALILQSGPAAIVSWPGPPRKGVEWGHNPGTRPFRGPNRIAI